MKANVVLTFTNDGGIDNYDIILVVETPFNILIVNFSFKMTMNFVQLTDNYLSIVQAMW